VSKQTTDTGRRRKYEHNKLLEAPADNHDGRPSLELEDGLLDALKQHHVHDRKTGKIRERPQEPPDKPEEGKQ
jgi:hypothetical protein